MTIARDVRQSPSRVTAITPSDTDKFQQGFILVQTSGSIVVELADGGQLTFAAFTGEIKYQVVKVLATGTTATNIFRLN